MSNNYKQKALQATINRINSIEKQSNFLIKNFWKVLALGIFVSFWAPTHNTGVAGFKNKSALEIGLFEYPVLVIGTAIGYTIVCFIAHHIWKWQDKKRLKELNEKKRRLEEDINSDRIASFR